MGEPEDVDAMLEEALDRIEDSDRHNGHGHAEPMAALIRGEPPKKQHISLQSLPIMSSNGGVKMEAERPLITGSTSLNERARRSSNSSSSQSRSASRSKEKKKRRRSPSRDRLKRTHSRSRRHSRSHSRDHRRTSHRRSRSDRRKSRSSDRSRHRSRTRRSRSRDRKKSRERRRRSRSRSSRRRSRSWTPPRVLDHRDRRGYSQYWRRSPHRGSRLPGPERRDVMPFTARRSPPSDANLDMNAEERDQRTIFIRQISRQTKPRDLEEFFSSVGHVRDVRIITDSKTRRSKGIGYVEFWEIEGVNLALALDGQKLLGAPLIIQPSLAERNRAANNPAGSALGFGVARSTGHLKICISQLHPSITEEMIERIFEPFGKIESIEMATNLIGLSKGFGCITFRHIDDGRRAIEQMNGFELAGKSMKVSAIEDRNNVNADEAGHQDIEMGASNRPLLANLFEGSSLETPKDAEEITATSHQIMEGTSIPPFATQCFMLSNMFDPTKEKGEHWPDEVRDDVLLECGKNGGVLHIFVDKDSPGGRVYVKCHSVVAAVKTVNALHGRWFSGKVVTANYVPVASYDVLFPSSVNAHSPTSPSPWHHGEGDLRY